MRGRKRISFNEYAERVAYKYPDGGITAMHPMGEFYGATSAVRFKCHLRHSWSASMNNVLHLNSGCPYCAGKARYSQSERESQLLAVLRDATFVKWVNGYKGQRSKAVIACSCGREWEATVHSLVTIGSGCPSCAGYGCNPSSRGTLYTLCKSDRSSVKIGISNDYERRLKELKKNTPFNWECIALIHHDDGSLIKSMEKHLHAMTSRAENTGRFDGHTEWRVLTDELLATLDDLQKALS